MKKINIFILDDHKIVRDGLRSLLSLEAKFKLVGEESSPERFLKMLPELVIDILILDISLPEMSGLDVLKQVKRDHPQIRVVMLSMHDSPEYILKSMREGASAYLPKDTDATQFIHAILEVSKTGVYYPAHLNSSSQPNLKPENPPSHEPNLLSPKEKEVLELMAKGMSSKQIAAEFGLSSRTVEAHRLNIMRKLSTNNSAETIAIAVKLNLI